MKPSPPSARPSRARAGDERDPSCPSCPGYPGYPGYPARSRMKFGYFARDGRWSFSVPSGAGPGLFHFPQAPGLVFFISLRRRARTPFAWLRATRAAQSRRPGRFAARFPSMADTASVSVWRGRALRPLGPEGWRGNADGAGVERGVGPYRDRAAQQPGRRDCAARRMARSQASGASARRRGKRKMNKVVRAGYRRYGPFGCLAAGPFLTQRTMIGAGRAVHISCFCLHNGSNGPFSSALRNGRQAPR